MKGSRSILPQNFTEQNSLVAIQLCDSEPWDTRALQVILDAALLAPILTESQVNSAQRMILK